MARAHVHEDSEDETSEDDSDESEEEHKVVEESSKVEKESKTVEEEVVDSEDVGHLELAWEMLEMARMIWSKKSQVRDSCLRHSSSYWVARHLKIWLGSRPLWKSGVQFMGLSQNF